MANIGQMLDNLVSNGRVEVGLEVGADPGLNPIDYVRVPHSMATLNTSQRKSKGKETATTDHGPEWVMVHEGKAYSTTRGHDGKFVKGAEENGFVFSKPQDWAREIALFIAANRGHIREDSISEDQSKQVHAIRYWSMKSGFLITSHTNEYMKVEDPQEDVVNEVSNDEIEFVARYAEQSLTACVARAASWRKTNHATGGGANGLATGFPRRWMQKEGMWSHEPDRVKSDSANRKATTAFYVATHAVSVHAVLALLVPGDTHHYCIFEKKYGAIRSWDVRESTQVRITPRTGVAGAAMVSDAVEVVKMMISEGIAPLLSNSNSLRALRALYSTVESEGMRVAVYANWFFNNHPDRDTMARVPFNQKSSEVAAIIGELGVVATKYYRGSAIAASPALANAASQLAGSNEQSRWAAITRAKQSSVSLATLSAYGRISGATGGGVVDSLASKDEAQVRQAVSDYNSLSARFAGLYNVSTFVQPTPDEVVASMSIADARAEEISKLAT